MGAEVDSSHDGKISFEEFIRYLSGGEGNDRCNEAAASFIDRFVVDTGEFVRKFSSIATAPDLHPETPARSGDQSPRDDSAWDCCHAKGMDGVRAKDADPKTQSTQAGVAVKAHGENASFW